MATTDSDPLLDGLFVTPTATQTEQDDPLLDALFPKTAAVTPVQPIVLPPSLVRNDTPVQYTGSDRALQMGENAAGMAFATTASLPEIAGNALGKYVLGPAVSSLTGGEYGYAGKSLLDNTPLLAAEQANLLSQRPDLQPQTTAENLITAAGHAVGVAPFLGGVGLAAAPGLAAANTASDFLGQKAQEEFPGQKWVGPAVAAVSGVGGMGVVNALDRMGMAATEGASAGQAIGAGLHGATATPLIASGVADVAAKAKALGVDLPPAVLTGDTTGLASTASGQAATLSSLRQLTTSMNKTIGVDSPVYNESTLADAKEIAGDRYTAVTPKLSMDPNDPKLLSGLADVQNAAMQSGSTEAANTIKKLSDDIVGDAVNANLNGTKIPGSVYRERVDFASPLYKALGSPDSNVQQYAYKLKGVLDDAVARSTLADGNADAVTELKDLNQVYKNIKTVEPLAAEANTSGLVNPQRLSTRVLQRSGGLYGNAGDLGDLANAGRLLPVPTLQGGLPAVAAPASAPASNLLTTLLNHPITAGIGAAAGGAVNAIGSHDPLGLWQHVVQNPGVLVPGAVAGNLLGGGAGLAVKGGRSLVRNYLASPAYTKELLNPTRLPSPWVGGAGPGVNLLSQQEQ